MPNVSFFARLLGRARGEPPASPLAAGVAALERGLLDDALIHFELALAGATTPGERALVQNKRGLAFLQRRDRAAAIAAFVEALAEDGRCAPVVVNIGNLLLEDGVLDDAVAHYEAALRFDAAYAPAQLNIGIAYKRLGRHADAVRAFRRAAQLEARAHRDRR
jgi:tetratricopeptide (TPR) repeat protein